MAKAKIDIPTQVPAVVARPVYAGVGATDRVIEAVRGAVADVQKRAAAVQQDLSKSMAEVDYQPRALREQATRVLTERVDTIGKDAQARRKVVEQRLADLQADARDLPVRFQKLVDDQFASAAQAYDELVHRGETLVGRIRNQPATHATAASAETTTTKAKTTRTQATKTAKKSASTAKKTARKSPAASSAKATATSAEKTAENAAQAATDAASKVGDSE